MGWISGEKTKLVKVETVSDDPGASQVRTTVREEHDAVLAPRLQTRRLEHPGVRSPLSRPAGHLAPHRLSRLGRARRQEAAPSTRSRFPRGASGTSARGRPELSQAPRRPRRNDRPREPLSFFRQPAFALLLPRLPAPVRLRGPPLHDHDRRRKRRGRPRRRSAETADRYEKALLRSRGARVSRRDVAPARAHSRSSSSTRSTRRSAKLFLPPHEWLAFRINRPPRR